MVNRTFRTIPLLDIQRHFIYDMPTISASFRARKPSVNFNQFSSIPLAFVSKLADKFAPTSVANMECQFMVLHHIFNRQVLNHDGLVFVHQLSSQLMQKIFSTVSYLGVDRGYLLPLFVLVVRPLLFTRQRFLDSSKLRAQPLKVPWISDFVSIAGSNQARDAHIQPDRLIGLGQWFNSLVYEQRNVKTSRRIQLDRDGRRFAPLNCLLQRIGNASVHLASQIKPSLHLKADLVNSALPPLCFFLKLGYFACPAQKLANAF